MLTLVLLVVVVVVVVVGGSGSGTGCVPSISVLPATIVYSSLKLITYNLIFIRMVLQNRDLKNPVLVLGFGLGL